jgi:hypothetical protein
MQMKKFNKVKQIKLNYKAVYFGLVFFHNIQVVLERFAVMREFQLDIGRIFVLETNVLVQLYSNKFQIYQK